MKKIYLGDGLYAEYDGYQFRLYCDRFGMVHEVFLDDSTFRAFLLFAGQCIDREIVLAEKD
jgi:hypothetical protein